MSLPDDPAITALRARLLEDERKQTEEHKQSTLDAYEGELNELQRVIRKVTQYIERTGQEVQSWDPREYLTPSEALVLIREVIYQQSQR